MITLGPKSTECVGFVGLQLFGGFVFLAKRSELTPNNKIRQKIKKKKIYYYFLIFSYYFLLFIKIFFLSYIKQTKVHEKLLKT